MKKELLIVGNIAKDEIEGNDYYGGSAPAIAVNASRIGVSTGILSVLGKDGFSKKYRNFLRHESVDVSLVNETLDELPVCKVFTRENKISSRQWMDNGCQAALEQLPVDMERVNEFNIIHLVGCPPVLGEKIAKTSAKVAYEPGPRILRVKDFLSKDIINKSYFIFANEEEISVIQDNLGIEKPESILNMGPHIVVVTLGNKGSVIYIKGELKNESHRIDPYETQVTDPTGAGDAYKAGFYMGYFKNRSYVDSCRLGSLMGALVVSQEGVIITENNLQKFNQAAQNI